MHSPDSTPNPSHSKPRSRAARLLAATAGASSEGGWDAAAGDPDQFRYPATLFVWVRWFMFVTLLTLLVYHPDYTPFTYAAYGFFLTLSVAVNGVRPLLTVM